MQLMQQKDARSGQHLREKDLNKRVINLRWVYSLNAGGRKQRMSAFMVVGNGAGKVGYATAKAKDTSSAVKKAIAKASKSIRKVGMKYGRTPHHDITYKYGASTVTIRSAAPGSGIKCSNSIRLYMECLGMKDVVVKSRGSRNPINVIKAIDAGLRMTSSPREIAMRRGISYAKLLDKPNITPDEKAQENANVQV
jgi:small subunit ribosomal protein S5